MNDFNMYKSEQKVELVELECGIILPRKFIGKDPMWGLGGVCDKSNIFAEISAYHGGWIEQGGSYDYPIEDEKYCKGTVIYMGLFFKHWGHFLMDLIPRLWYPAIYPIFNDQVKVAYIGEEEPEGNYLEFLNLVGIKSEQLIHITQPTRFEKVIVPAYSCRPCIWYTEEYVNLFNTVINNALKNYNIPNYLSKIDKVYFTRKNLNKAKGSEFGENLIEQCFVNNGYISISPELLSLRDQIYIWNYSKEIACLNGSIPLNVIFSTNNSLKLIILNKTSLLHKNMYFYLLIRNVHHEFIDVYYEPFKGIPSSLGAGPFLLKITNDMQRYMKDNGLSICCNRNVIIKHNIFNLVKYCFSIINLKGKLYWCYMKLIGFLNIIKRKSVSDKLC